MALDSNRAENKQSKIKILIFIFKLLLRSTSESYNRPEESEI